MRRRSSLRTPTLVLAAMTVAAALPAAAQDSDEALAQKLSNPVASMISVPLQWNYDCCYGPSDGVRLTLNVQPVAPVHLNNDWNLIVRTILPLVYQQSVAPGVEESYGVSDITQSFFFSPSTPRNGVTWAVGPAFLWPVGTDELGTQKWAAGPTGLVLKVDGKSTYGLLANHLWSYAGADDRDDVSQTFVQPFYSYTTSTATTYGVNLEASYDWEHRTWNVPMNLSVSQLYTIGGQRVQFGIGAKLYLVEEGDSPDWGVRASATFLFPE
jgi:hypothetical protein